MEPTFLLVDDETGIAAAIARVFRSTVDEFLSKPCSYAAIQSAMYSDCKLAAILA